MKSFILLFITFILIMVNPSQAQNDNANKNPDGPAIHYHQIPDYPDAYTAENVAARMIDGLGYRYYWASKGLRTEDLNYKPSEDSRTTQETIDHIYGLSRFILSAPRSTSKEEMTFEEKREQTLRNFQLASNRLKEGKEASMDDYVPDFPFWNLINGPIADAIYHTGQVVAFRRASGNPIHPGVSMFSGKTME
jgi:hypothetical protein